jgi:hypothetical protein
MKATHTIAVVAVGLLAAFAARQDKSNTHSASRMTPPQSHHRSWFPNARMEFWAPGHKLSSDPAAMLTKAAYIPGARMGAAFQTPNGLPVYTFSDPLGIRNPWLPLATLVLDVLDGTVSGQTDHIERSILQGQTKTFMINGQPVQALIAQDKETVGGALSEITQDYFAQDDQGSVHYLGENATQYTNGKPSGHAGSWLYGVDTLYIGTIFPGYPTLGQNWEAEHVIEAGVGIEYDTLIATNTTITVPAGTFRNCMETLEVTKEGLENKWYCPSIGVVEEYVSSADVVTLTSHQSSYKLP